MNRLYPNEQNIIIMRINVTVVPNARVCEIAKTGESDYKVRVDAPATRGEANSRLVEMLADFFGVPNYTVVVVKGFKSRRKIIEIDM
jgi:uncharacterized protein